MSIHHTGGPRTTDITHMTDAEREAFQRDAWRNNDRVRRVNSAVSPIVEFNYDGPHGRSVTIVAYVADRFEGHVPRFNVERRESGVRELLDTSVVGQGAVMGLQWASPAISDRLAWRLVDGLADQADTLRRIGNVEADALGL